MPRRTARTTGGPHARATAAQYRALRYWAGYTTDQGFGYERASGPAPYVRQQTVDTLLTHGWWRWTVSGYAVTDPGRRACGLPPAGRDRACPDCGARPGERCRYAAPSGGTVHRDTNHPGRSRLAPAPPRPPASSGVRGILLRAGADLGVCVGLITAT